MKIAGFGLFFSVLTLSGSVRAADPALTAAETAYMDCVDPIVTREVDRQVQAGIHLDRQRIALILFHAEQACDGPRKAMLSFYPPDQRGRIDDASHKYFIDSVAKNLGIE